MSETEQSRRGRKPKFGQPMTSAERKRRSRAKLAQEGGKELMIKVNGRYKEAVQAMAKATGTEPSELLRLIVSESLDRLIDVTQLGGAMYERGATDEEVDEFMRAHLFPKLPELTDLEGG